MRLNFHGNHERQLLSTGLLAFASMTVLAAAGCSGEAALRPRDGGALSGTSGMGGRGGGGGGKGGAAGGSAGSVGGDTSGAAGDGTGGGGSGGGTGGSDTGGTGGDATGAAGTEGGGTTGSGGTGGGKTNGATCTLGSECASTACVDGVCCESSCALSCMACSKAKTGQNDGLCRSIPDGVDPDNECGDPTPTAMCGQTGNCDGAGHCRKYGPSTVCAQTASCDATQASIILQKICNGSGSCVPNPSMTQSCNGFLCGAGPPVACATSCTDDTVCTSGGFCSAAACVAAPANLAGNGDLEYGTATGWSAASGSSTITVTMAPAPVHGGQYALLDSARQAQYQGQGYFLPTGLGVYNVSAWVMQKDPNWASAAGVLTLGVKCKDTTLSTYFQNFATGAMAQGTWVQLSGMVDLRSTGGGADCDPASGGLVRSAQLYLNQDYNQTCMTGTCPDLYMDDLVVTVTDGHNLIGNPNFEAGFLDGWGVSQGMASPSISTTLAHGGTHSLYEKSRQYPGTGPKWTLPTGRARYTVAFWVMHAGTQVHNLSLQTTYTCAGMTGLPAPAPIATATQVAGGNWTQLMGTAILPPPDAPAGCNMTSAAVYVTTEGTTCGAAGTATECPDLYLDDASITIK